MLGHSLARQVNLTHILVSYINRKSAVYTYQSSLDRRAAGYSHSPLSPYKFISRKEEKNYWCLLQGKPCFMICVLLLVKGGVQIIAIALSGCQESGHFLCACNVTRASGDIGRINQTVSFP